MPSEVAVPMGRGPDDVRRMLVREILPGDERKFVARSNDAKTGGGARDLRLRPADAFADFVEEMFPARESVTRRLKGEEVAGIVLRGDLHWERDKVEKTAPIEIWQATAARPGEMRIAKVHKFDLAAELAEARREQKAVVGGDGGNTGRLLLMFVELWSGRVFPAFAFSSSLDNPSWDRKVASFLKKCLAHSRRGRAASGWLDLEKNASYP